MSNVCVTYISIAERLRLRQVMPSVGECFASLSDHDCLPPKLILKLAGREEDQSIYLQALAKDFNMFLVELNAALGCTWRNIILGSKLKESEAGLKLHII